MSDLAVTYVHDLACATPSSTASMTFEVVIDLRDEPDVELPCAASPTSVGGRRAYATVEI
jgi:hypothetical protein